ncbi:MAG: hypothetical protein ACREXJ_00140 [Gammaproteobacteria bacterium]
MRGAARPIALTGADQVVSPNQAIYRGYSVRETAGAAAVVRVYDDPAAAAGTLLDTIALAANASQNVLHDGVFAASGVFVDVVSGAVEGSIRIG